MSTRFVLLSVRVLAIALRVTVLVATALPGSLRAEYRRMTDAEIAALKTDETNRNDPVRFTNQSATHYLNTRGDGTEVPVFFFPPEPPPLGAEVLLANPLDPGPPAPVELAPYANEIFYPRLAARLADGSLTAAWRTRLDEYRSAKTTLQNELRARIATLSDADPVSREQQLAAFATEQSPRILALEAVAEKLRSDLRRTQFLGLPVDNDDWILATAGRLKVRAEAFVPPAPAEILRGLAFYQDGLSIEQRDLLRERTSGSARWAGAGIPDGPVFSFTPAPAQVWLERKAPPALQQKIEHFISVRTALKQELSSAFHDLAATEESRTEVARRLAAGQAPRFAAAEALADDIRRELATQPSHARLIATTTLPADLAGRIATYRAHKNDALRRLHQLLTVKPSGSAAPRDAAAKAEPGKPAPARHSLAEFDRVQGELVKQLDEEKATIRTALADYIRKTGGAQDRKSIDDLLKDFENARQRQETWEKFRDYEAAALLPGLSPPQRRLLFDAAVVQLGLPLPAGTPIP